MMTLSHLRMRYRWWKIRARTLAKDLGEIWCNTHWFWLVLLLIYMWHLAAMGHIVAPLAFGFAVAYFIVNTWPRRFIMDLICAYGLFVTAVNMALKHGG